MTRWDRLTVRGRYAATITGTLAGFALLSSAALIVGAR